MSDTAPKKPVVCLFDVWAFKVGSVFKLDLRLLQCLTDTKFVSVTPDVNDTMSDNVALKPVVDVFGVLTLKVGSVFNFVLGLLVSLPNTECASFTSDVGDKMSDSTPLKPVVVVFVWTIKVVSFLRFVPGILFNVTGSLVVYKLV